MRRFLALGLILCLLLCSCGGDEGDNAAVSEAGAVYGGVLNLSMGVSDTLNPLLAGQKTVRDALFAVYEPLIYVTADQELSPVLAESWSFNSDATALTLKLREGVLWHDGTELTAGDVVYTIDTIKNNPESPYSHLLRYVSAATENSAYSVTISLSRSYSQLLYSLYFPVIPLNAGDIDSTAIGTGPFMFESYSPGQSLTLTRFEGYREGSAGFDQVVFNIVRDDVTMASAFSTGVTDAVQRSVYDTDEFALRDSSQVELYCGSAFEYMGLNYDNPIFSSVAVRSAMSNAIDREEVVLDGYGSLAVEANIPMHPRSLRYSPSLSLVDYNAAGAEESLFYDGWTDNDGDGVLSKDISYSQATETDTGTETETETEAVTETVTQTETVSLSFGLLVNRENSRRVMAANIIAAQLGECGFSVTVEELDFEDYLSRIENGSFDAYLGGTDIGNLYDLEFLLHTDGEQNYSGYSGEYMDMALETLAAAADEESFTNACSIVQEVFSREQPIIGIAFLDDGIILSENISGGTGPMFMSPFGNIVEWSFSI